MYCIHSHDKINYIDFHDKTKRITFDDERRERGSEYLKAAAVDKMGHIVTCILNAGNELSSLLGFPNINMIGEF